MCIRDSPAAAPRTARPSASNGRRARAPRPRTWSIVRAPPLAASACTRERHTPRSSTAFEGRRSATSAA
eukprot:3788675-Prymnesium_polylepis.1